MRNALAGWLAGWLAWPGTKSAARSLESGWSRVDMHLYWTEVIDSSSAPERPEGVARRRGRGGIRVQVQDRMGQGMEASRQCTVGAHRFVGTFFRLHGVDDGECDTRCWRRIVVGGGDLRR
ncbi:hypothetical protein BKA80DRAFT_261685 [Phyllosticta citrichinensis]